MALSTSALHIMLVDDQQSILDLVSEMLGAVGCKVSCFTTGEDALAFASSRIDEIDLVLTDINLPGICGGELLFRLHDLRRDLPAIAASGIPAEIHNLPNIGKGTKVPFLQKPFSMDELYSMLETVLPRFQSG